MENINALDEIHKGACMGMDAIHFILDKVEDKDLDKYIFNGIKDDHECTSIEEAKEKVRKMYDTLKVEK